MAAPTHKGACTALLLGPLDVETINRTLCTEMEPGDLYLSRQAHWHIAKDHPADYDRAMQALRVVAEKLGFLGQAPKQTDNFEVVVRFRSIANPSVFLLLAIGFQRDERGNYRVKSAYSIPERAFEARRAVGRLLAPVR
ncbi:hypothetical protein [Gluconacetobacter diazotrophicus]|uniref:hypothetical protein n=1 Tax=Gluconacetobacter diazotrophicus TaxID=33996 RepID=UPI0011990B35|nr:hypothetical protein [Gluconacetobacter diazotrophicus]TWB00390.1 hypothetical protein FBZ86_1374 [Gluconacetobacter diazotrophicus]